MRVLLVDADAERGAGVVEQLESQNLDVRRVDGPSDAMSAMQERSFRLVVIEHAIDGGAGALIQHMRAAGHGSPAVVLTDDADPHAKIRLLDDGADDVLVRPLVPGLLTAQVRSLLRRCTPSEGAVLKLEDLSLDLRSLAVIRRGQAISTTSRELAVLEYLMRNRQRVVSRVELAEAIWDDETLPGSNVIEVFIARLRRKVDRPFDTPLIHTIVGRGYMMSNTRPNHTGDAVDPIADEPVNGAG